MKIEYFDYETEYGTLRVGVLENDVCFCYFTCGRDISREMARLMNVSLEENETELSHLAYKQIREYMNGERKEFELPYKLISTPFHVQVWKKLIELPYGITTVYSELAASIGCPTSTRAVASAVARNPLFAIVPCHRVLAVSGMGGYAWGLPLKAYLLNMESDSKQRR